MSALIESDTEIDYQVEELARWRRRLAIQVPVHAAQQVHELLYMCGNKAAIFYGADLEAPEGLLAGAVGWVMSWSGAYPCCAALLRIALIACHTAL